MGKKWVTDIGLCVLVLAIVAGCAPAHFRANPQLQEKVTSIKTVAIMPPGVTVYQLAVGGDTQLMDDLTAAATQHVAKAIEEKLKGHAGFVFTPFPSPLAILDTGQDLTAAGVQAEVEDTQALFEAVSTSVLLHTYEPKVRDAPDQTFPEKLKNFDYSMGPEVQRLAKLVNADALLFTSGVDHISTGARKALITLGVLALATSPPHLLLAAVAAVGGPEPETLSVALVDGKTGALLWYKVSGYGGLTDPDGAAGLAERVFENFPVGATPPTRNEYDWSCLPNCPQAGGGQPPR
jgi:hypothetical protein